MEIKCIKCGCLIKHRNLCEVCTTIEYMVDVRDAINMIIICQEELDRFHYDENENEYAATKYYINSYLSKRVGWAEQKVGQLVAEYVRIGAIKV
jgi:hypothetical protein